MEIGKDRLSHFRIHLVIMTGHNEIESEEIDKYIQPYHGHIYKYISTETFAEYKIGVLGKCLVARIRLNRNGSYSDNGSSFVSREAVGFFPNIKMIICAGIACSVSKDYNIGDILISDKIIPYEFSRISTTDGEAHFELRGEKYLVMTNIMNFLSIHQWIKNNSNEVHYGSFLSGDKLIDNPTYKAALLEAAKNEGECVGIEMEGAGVANNINVSRQYIGIIVKGVSDWGDGTINNNEEEKRHRQQTAAYNAAHYLYGLLNRDAFVRLLGIPIIHNIKPIDDVLINGYKMFYYRHSKRMSYAALTRAINGNYRQREEICKKLREFELVKSNEEGDQFRCTNYYWINRIEQILECKGELSNLNTGAEIRSFYKKYYGRHSLFPTTNIKAVVFDFDGTLTKKEDGKSSWQRIWSMLGYKDNEAFSLYSKYKEGEITHAKWCELTADYFIKRNLTKAQVISLGEKTKLLNNCESFLEKLLNNGIMVFICSGSIDTMINAALPNSIRERIKLIKSNKFTYDSNGNLEQIVGTKYDFEGKSKFIKEQVLEKYQLNPSEVAFVGNSDNDIWAYESGVRTILINPCNVEPANRRVWNYCLLNVGDLFEIEPYLLPIQ